MNLEHVATVETPVVYKPQLQTIVEGNINWTVSSTV
jgi:hypothetical protein